MTTLPFETFLVGHAQEEKDGTGCTVVLCPSGAVGAVEVRGAAPGTRETDLLDPLASAQEVHAVLLTGGSAFGLSAATGVMEVLAERGIGFAAGVHKVPIVSAAVLFDLDVGQPTTPDAAMGRRAVEAAKREVAEGCVGAGCGATVAKSLGMQGAIKSGIGCAVRQTTDGLQVAALVAVNALGDVIDPADGHVLAAPRLPEGGFLPTVQLWARARHLPQPPRESTNTTLGVVMTNAALDKTALARIARFGQDALARCILPVHTPFDGDALFALATPQVDADLAVVGVLAQQAVSEAILRAVRLATPAYGLPTVQQLGNS